MMKKSIFKIVCLITACLLLCCGCGDKGAEILIGEADGTETADSAEAGAAEASEGTKQPEAARQDTTIRVYVCGAVVNPGVVEIPQGSRVEDALKAALEQIEKKKYASVLCERGVSPEKIWKYGFVFKGKEVLIGDNTSL